MSVSATSSEHGEHHVKFNIQEEEFKNHHENLEIKNISPNVFHVNLGYLKVEHNYRVTFSLHLEGGSVSSENVRILTERSSKHVAFKDIKRESDNLYTLTVHFFAYHEKYDQETVYLSIDDGHLNSNGHHKDNGHHSKNVITLHFEAKVLGKHQGTPLLRNGITLLHTHSNNQLASGHSSEKSHFNLN